MTDEPLTPTRHDTDVAGLTYVYAVVSRRAGGVSVGVNLNPNRACNWRCVYCQVPGLSRGAAPALDLGRLEAELRHLLGDLLHGEFMARRVPEGLRRVTGIAFSGDGEPTLSPRFPEAVAMVGRIMAEVGLAGSARLVVITNGSRVSRPAVQEGLATLAGLGGELWFKVDRATAEGTRRVNSVHLAPERVLSHLALAASLCPTWVQTCMFSLDGRPPAPEERVAYLGLLAAALARGAPLRGVYLYGIARPSHQPEALRLGPLPDAWMQALARDIEALGLPVVLTP